MKNQNILLEHVTLLLKLVDNAIVNNIKIDNSYDYDKCSCRLIVDTETQQLAIQIKNKYGKGAYNNLIPFSKYNKIKDDAKTETMFNKSINDIIKIIYDNIIIICNIKL